MECFSYLGPNQKAKYKIVIKMTIAENKIDVVTKNVTPSEYIEGGAE